MGPARHVVVGGAVGAVFLPAFMAEAILGASAARTVVLAIQTATITGRIGAVGDAVVVSIAFCTAFDRKTFSHKR